MIHVFPGHLFMACLSRVRTVFIWRETEVLESTTGVLGATGSRLIHEPPETSPNLLKPPTITMDASRSLGRRITAGTRNTMRGEVDIWS